MAAVVYQERGEERVLFGVLKVMDIFDFQGFLEKLNKNGAAE